MTVTRYGRTTTVTVHERRCLRYGVFRSQPVRVFLVCEPRRPALALVTTDPTASAVEIIERYLAGHSPGVVDERRQRARWYTTKTHPSYQDMITKLRRVVIAAQFSADPQVNPTPEQIHAIALAWADVAA